MNLFRHPRLPFAAPIACSALAAAILVACGGSTQPDVVPALAISTSGSLLGVPFRPTSATASVNIVGGNDPEAVQLTIKIADWALQCDRDPGVDGGRSVYILLDYLGPPPIPPGTYTVSQPLTTNVDVTLTGSVMCTVGSHDDSSYNKSGDAVTITHYSSGYVAGHFTFASGLSGDFSIPFACVAPLQPDVNDAGPCTGSTDAGAND